MKDKLDSYYTTRILNETLNTKLSFQLINQLGDKLDIPLFCNLLILKNPVFLPVLMSVQIVAFLYFVYKYNISKEFNYNKLL